MLTEDQEKWVSKASSLLATAQPPNEKSLDTTNYESLRKACLKRIEKAIAQDDSLKIELGEADSLNTSGDVKGACVRLRQVFGKAGEILSSDQVKRKALPKKYKNEQFQKNDKGKVLPGGEFHGKTTRRTHYYDEQEQDESALRVDSEGRLTDREGKLVSGEHGIVANAETGTVHTFDTTKQTVNKDNYTEVNHHSGPLAGGDTMGAGEVKLDKGVIRHVSDQSGHYRPDGEITHQMLDRLDRAGVQRRDQKLVMTAPDGKVYVVSDNSILDMWSEVQAFDKDGPNDSLSKEEQKNVAKDIETKRGKLRDLGVGPANKDATVDVFSPDVYFSSQEWETLQGDEQKIKDRLVEKTGTDRAPRVYPNDMEATNQAIAIHMRLKLVDEKRTRVQKKAEQYLQTGGNAKAIKGKDRVNEELLDLAKNGDPQNEKRNKIGKLIAKDDSEEEEEAKLRAMIKKLGGDAKLINLGVPLPKTLSLEDQFMILSKGRVPDGFHLETEELEQNPEDSESTKSGDAKYLRKEGEESEEDEEVAYQEDDVSSGLVYTKNLQGEESESESETTGDVLRKEPELTGSGQTNYFEKEGEEVGYQEDDVSGGLTYKKNLLDEESESETETTNDPLRKDVDSSGGGETNYFEKEGEEVAYQEDDVSGGLAYTKNLLGEELESESESTGEMHGKKPEPTGTGDAKYLRKEGEESEEGAYQEDDVSSGLTYTKNLLDEEPESESESTGEMHGKKPEPTGTGDAKYLMKEGEEGEFQEDDDSGGLAYKKDAQDEKAETEEESLEDKEKEDAPQNNAPQSNTPPIRSNDPPPRSKPVSDPLSLRRQPKRPERTASPDPRQREFDELGGEGLLLELKLTQWKKRNSAALDNLRKLDKQRQGLLEKQKELEETGQQVDRGAATKDVDEAMEKLRTEIKNKNDPMPSKALLAKLSVAEKIKSLKEALKHVK